MKNPPAWSLVVHGGCGQLSPETLPGPEAECRAGLSAALAAGKAVLSDGGSAVDAVVAAVSVLEDHPLFNAGRGAVFTAEGRTELDAAVMDGASRKAGAVAGVTRTRNPVQLARAVMQRSPHVLLARDGADVFALEQGLPQVEPGWFRVESRWQALQMMKAAAARGEELFDADLKYGTVGAVARDAHGHLAAATSTGGLTGKRWGRIGDSPLIGAGTLADDRSVALSCTGSGEGFIRAGVGHEMGALVRLAGLSPAQAAERALADVNALGGTGGIIFIGSDGMPGWVFSTPGMFRGRATACDEDQVAIWGSEG
ncbi:isoaspartyl peptidase/L-asparaginase family protein [Sandarakinorhabdus oryzae]|uniref:isoaspartyl peptidase/L-asparaginase family protein n=1 Tax=Sandarakinorhabdus oryzae TaxID=2675220 RepID=UPI0012E1DCA7|nr:isoaspartyl peptidase/L-asparaginase [Sandarakinorhabdus oryzae]